MSIARRDDRHNADLVREIAEGFNQAVGSRREDDEDGEPRQDKPRFTITGDSRDTTGRRPR
ncbi:hypothetical protein [Prauserella muralis]|uniref:Uncharacterized protein n=1 Tax=Prauserella muralis TaxID=588067 RepID=A0A2V4BED3_9PSEU|nr:hypothetical protein [Prauserella muralis]PXY32409.1 hypothetical protein BAY60_09090 [Prauserella muralis]TWE23902.1 hypothetical protein FHX69_5204 [Prauserella muralis]